MRAADSSAIVQVESDGFAPGQGKPADFSTSEVADIEPDSSAAPAESAEPEGSSKVRSVLLPHQQHVCQLQFVIDDASAEYPSAPCYQTAAR